MKLVVASFTGLLLLLCVSASSQTITGAWRGKIGSANAELKLIKKGDSLLGTSYYYTSHNKYRRYAVKGYFDPMTNAVVIWDDEMLEDKLTGKGEALLSVADFNCPGEGVMKLDGETTDRDDMDKPKGIVALKKVSSSSFSDEWDYVIENYIYGASHPDIIDSVNNIRRMPKPLPEERERDLASANVKAPKKEAPTNIAVTAPPIEIKKPATTATSSSAQQKYTTRVKKLATVIPVSGDTVELRFYDNAVVDGDSIAVFLNDKLVFEHVRLNNKP